MKERVSEKQFHGGNRGKRDETNESLSLGERKLIGLGYPIFLTAMLKKAGKTQVEPLNFLRWFGGIS